MLTTKAAYCKIEHIIKWTESQQAQFMRRLKMKQQQNSQAHEVGSTQRPEKLWA